MPIRIHSKIKAMTDVPEVADRFNRVLALTVQALAESGVAHVFIGGVASGGWGRPRSTHDIDVFVQPEDAERVLRTLGNHGFEIERTDPTWLFKAFKERVLVDIIFKSKGEIYLDSEMVQRSRIAQFHGQKLRLVAPEDLIMIKAVAYSEVCPNHWHDATALLSHAHLDWDYLLHRAKRAPRRILSLLLYAQSIDVWVPNSVVQSLFNDIFSVTPASQSQSVEKNPYAAIRLRGALAEDPRTHELDIQVECEGDCLLLRGEVMTAERKQRVQEVAEDYFPKNKIDNRIRVFHYPDRMEGQDLR